MSDVTQEVPRITSIHFAAEDGEMDQIPAIAFGEPSEADAQAAAETPPPAAPYEGLPSLGGTLLVASESVDPDTLVVDTDCCLFTQGVNLEALAGMDFLVGNVAMRGVELRLLDSDAPAPAAGSGQAPPETPWGLWASIFNSGVVEVGSVFDHPPSTE